VKGGKAKSKKKKMPGKREDRKKSRKGISSFSCEGRRKTASNVADKREGNSGVPGGGTSCTPL